MKLGAVVIPPRRCWDTATSSTASKRGNARHVVVNAPDAARFGDVGGSYTRIAIKPKLVEHSHVSYPIGHLSTMYWAGIQPGDIHLNVSSPGWGKHAWSNVYAPWLAEATVMVFNYTRFNAKALLDQIVRCGVSTFCAPPTVWRMLIQEDLGRWSVPLREALSAGEPLNPE
jgi:acetyl-CoA synthetase